MNALHQARTAYANPAAITANARSGEYKVLARVTQKLRAASRPDAPFAERAEALHDNRRLWLRVARLVADDENRFTPELRQRLFFLAEFSLAHTSKVLDGDADTEALIEINTAVMRGLRGDAAQ